MHGDVKKAGEHQQQTVVKCLQEKSRLGLKKQHSYREKRLGAGRRRDEVSGGWRAKHVPRPCMEMTETQDHLDCGSRTARATLLGNIGEREGRPEIKGPTYEGIS